MISASRGATCASQPRTSFAFDGSPTSQFTSPDEGSDLVLHVLLRVKTESPKRESEEVPNLAKLP